MGAVVEVDLPKGRRRRLQILQIRAVDQKRPSNSGAKGAPDVQERDCGSRR
jgi:hypothetical protein